MPNIKLLKPVERFIKIMSNLLHFGEPRPVDYFSALNALSVIHSIRRGVRSGSSQGYVNPPIVNIPAEFIHFVKPQFKFLQSNKSSRCYSFSRPARAGLVCACKLCPLHYLWRWWIDAVIAQLVLRPTVSPTPPAAVRPASEHRTARPSYSPAAVHVRFCILSESWPSD